MIRALLWRIAFPAVAAASAAGVLVTATTTGYCAGYLKAWRELQCSPPVVMIDDAVLSEATALCRDLVTHFPDNADYKSRLTNLKNLKALQFRKQTSPNP